MIIRLIPFDARDGEIVLDVGEHPDLIIELGKYSRVHWQNEREAGQTKCLEANYLIEFPGLSVTARGERTP